MSQIHINMAKCTFSILGSIFILGGIGFTYKMARNFLISQKLKRLLLKKQKEREDTFKILKNEFQISPEYEKIISLELEELIEELQSRNLTAVKVYSAYMAKAIEVNEKINCITEFNPNGMKIAKELDKLNKKDMKILHGIPFCVKENHNLEGMHTTVGYSKNLENGRAKENAVIVQIFIDYGAIPFCKTNVPQTMFSFGSDNPIFKTTLNPICPEKLLSPGGSSSGTAALIAASGSIFGTGTDVGGSLRIPSHFCGTTTIRPTLGRISGDNRGTIQAASFGLKGVAGIICKNVKTLAFLFRLMTQESIQNKYDPLVPPIPWNEQIFSSKESLRIGYFTSVNYMPVIGDGEKVTLKAKEHLEILGHTCVQFEMPDSFAYMKNATDFLVGHFKFLFLPMLANANDQISNSIKDIHYYANLPNWRRKLLAFWSPLNLPFKEASIRNAILIKAGMDLDSYVGLSKAMIERSKFISEILKKMKEKNLDLLLSPAFPTGAIGIGDETKCIMAVVYTMVWNLADFPAGTLKMGIETGESIENYEDQNDYMLKALKESARKSVNCPLSVQIIGKCFREEQVLRIMNELENIQNLQLIHSELENGT